MFKQYYLKGVGVRNFRNECKKDIYKKVGTYHCSTHPHNTYLQILSETLPIGFLFFMIFLGFIFVNIFQYRKNIYIKHEKINIILWTLFCFYFSQFFSLEYHRKFF